MSPGSDIIEYCCGRVVIACVRSSIGNLGYAEQSFGVKNILLIVTAHERFI